MLEDFRANFLNECVRRLKSSIFKNLYLREAIAYFVENKMDVFVNLLTGFGKSLIYQALPLVFDVTRAILSWSSLRW